MDLDDASHTCRICSIIGLEPPRMNQLLFLYSIGDRYHLPSRHEPIGAIEATKFHEQFLGAHLEVWFNLVVDGEALERISGRAVTAVSFFSSTKEE